MNTIDLHMHTRNSDDGQFSSQEIIDMALASGVKTIAISDHNSVGAYFEEYNNKGVHVVPAIELDCTFEGKEFHLLGYGIDVNASIYKDIKMNLHEQEAAASKKYLDFVNHELALSLDPEVLTKRSPNGVYIAETLCEAAMAVPANRNNEYLKEYFPGGTRSDNPQVNFYWDYFSQSKPGHYPISFMTMEEAIDIYRSQGAMIVLAHPGNNVKENGELLARIIALGIDGLEVYSSYHDDVKRAYYRAKAQANNLVMTCGSDFHGRTKPNVVMGMCKMPIEEEDILRQHLTECGHI